MGKVSLILMSSLLGWVLFQVATYIYDLFEANLIDWENEDE